MRENSTNCPEKGCAFCVQKPHEEIADVRPKLLAVGSVSRRFEESSRTTAEVWETLVHELYLKTRVWVKPPRGRVRVDAGGASQGSAGRARRGPRGRASRGAGWRTAGRSTAPLDTRAPLRPFRSSLLRGHLTQGTAWITAQPPLTRQAVLRREAPGTPVSLSLFSYPHAHQGDKGFAGSRAHPRPPADCPPSTVSNRLVWHDARMSANLGDNTQFAAARI